MGNILQEKVEEIINRNESSVFGLLFFKINFKIEMKEAFIEDIVDENRFNIDDLNDLDINFSREELVKAVSESLGISIIEFLSMPADTVENLLNEKRIMWENATIEKFFATIKERLVKAEVLKNPETFDVMYFVVGYAICTLI